MQKLSNDFYFQHGEHPEPVSDIDGHDAFPHYGRAGHALVRTLDAQVRQAILSTAKENSKSTCIHIYSSAAATFGTCVGLFFLAMLYRSLSAARRTAELHWAKSVSELKYCALCCHLTTSQSKVDDQELPRFSIQVDIWRGLIEGFNSFVGYFLMLAVSLISFMSC